MAAQKKAVKKLSKVGEGTAVFLSQEVRKLGWKQGEYVWVEIVEGDRLVLKKVKE